LAIFIQTTKGIKLQLPDNKQGKNKPYIFESKRKVTIKPIILQSTFMGRTDFNDLGDSFQITFKEVANKYFEIEKRRYY